MALNIDKMHFEAGLDNEAALIEGIKKGERLSFDALVEMYRQRGINIAYNIVGNLEDAKDVLQEAFVKVYMNIKNFRQESKFSTWFYRIVVNCSIDFLRKKKKSGKVFSDTLVGEDGREKKIDVADTKFEPSRIIVNAELSRNLQACIDGLSQRQRICFILKHQEGFKIDEISQVLKCSSSTVKVHLFRAVENLRQGLAKYLAE